MMTSKLYNRFAYAFWVAGSVLGYVVAYRYTTFGGCMLMGLAGVVLLSAPTIVRRMETGERFVAEYGSYEGFRARASEVIDYEWLFRNRDTRSRRWLIRYVMVQTNLPREHATRFVDSLTEDERPATLPPWVMPTSPTPPKKKGDA